MTERSRPARRIRVPRTLLRRPVGLGDLLARITASIGVPACGPCAERAAALNRRVVLFSRPASHRAGPAPAPGCWFSGTNCYGFVQTVKFCCGDGTEYSEMWGWCIGVWGAMPCLGGPPHPDRPPFP